MTVEDILAPDLPAMAHEKPNARRVEEASLNAWPAMQQVLLDGWLLRFSRGFTKRANCIVPLYERHSSSLSATPGTPGTPGISGASNVRLDNPDTTDQLQATMAEKVRYCENLYAREQLKTIFRLTADTAHVLAAGQESGNAPATDYETTLLDTYLARRGYERLDETLVVAANLAEPPASPARPARPDIQFAEVSVERWLHEYQQFTDIPDQAHQLHAIILRNIPGECCFGTVSSGKTTVACGLAVLERELTGLFDIVTHPGHRQQGHGRHLVSALLNWGSSNGASHAYLQMVATNHAAARLYAGLGFKELYKYWYRVA